MTPTPAESPGWRQRMRDPRLGGVLALIASGMFLAGFGAWLASAWTTILVALIAAALLAVPLAAMLPPWRDPKHTVAAGAGVLYAAAAICVVAALIIRLARS